MRREAAKATVLDALDRAQLPDGSLYGSWLHGDFHLDERSGTSLSDIDLILPGHSPRDRDRLISAVENNLPTGLVKRVAARAADDLGTPVLATHMWIALAGYAAAVGRDPARSTQLDGYLAAKTILMLLRSSSHERFLAVARRIKTPHAARALGIKLGTVHEPLLPESVSSLLSMVSPVYRDLFLEMRSSGQVTDQIKEEILSALDQTDPNIPSSLISHTRLRLYG